MKCSRIIAGAFIAFQFGCSQLNENQITSLHRDWEFRAVNGSEEWRSAEVPGVVHLDLLDHGVIPDPWVAKNEELVQWVEKESWEYRTYFDISKSQISADGFDLVFEGLDTYAEVRLNGQQVLSANNMFRTWRIPIEKHLRVGKNELIVTFQSPYEAHGAQVQFLDYQLPAGSEEGEVKVSPYTRKAAYHFGWDWGPRLVTSGIWRPVYLERYERARLADVQILQKRLADEEAELEAIVEVHTEKEVEVSLKVQNEQQAFSLAAGKNVLKVPFRIANPRRWWPSGWGDPYLYEIPVQLFHKGILLASDTLPVGLRTVELIQKKDSIGESFYFKVNGEKLFARGANYIPQSHFLPDVNAGDYSRLLAQVKESGMNMLRVWGGGIYEDDLFYQLCDELGILVWQDFMFANSMYPGDKEFLENVAAEVTDNIKRLRNHPSIIHWNGNNEMQVAWENWGWQDAFGYSEQDSVKIWQDYLVLFHYLIPSLVDSLDDRSYTTTSPLSNWGTPENFKFGSMHYWGVWHGGDSFEDYRDNVGRFMAEYGFQSFPDMETISYFADSSDWSLESQVMKHHQKSYVGNGMIEQHIKKYYGEAADFPDFVEKSQLTQTLAMQKAIDAHRLAKGYCWGSLFWQLNDCWPGPSWSAIDVFGREKKFYKALDYLYAPVAVIPGVEKDSLQFTMINDLIFDFSGVVTFKFYDQKNRKVGGKNMQVSCDKNSKKSLLTLQRNSNWDRVEITLFKDDQSIFQRIEYLDLL